MNEVTVVLFCNDNEENERIEVYVNHILVGGGYFGGEPEDNSRTRDYAWVEELIEKLATTLGSKVKRIIENE